MDGIAKSAPQPVESQEAPRVNDTKEPLTMFSGIPLELARSLGEDLNSLEGKRLDKVKEVFSFFNEEGKDFEEIMAVKLGRYFRVRLVNDTGAQSYLRLKTYYGFNFAPSVAPLNQNASLDQDAIFTRGTDPQTDVLYFTADTDTNNAEIYMRFSLNEYQNT